MMKSLLCSIAAVFLVGCLAEYEDVGQDKKYVDLIGAKYQTLSVLKLHGVTLDKNYKKVIDRYVVTVEPGFSGREVITKNDLQVGSMFKIIKVVECINCLPVNISFVIEIIPNQSDQNISIWLYDLSITDDAGRTLMDPKLFLKK